MFDEIKKNLDLACNYAVDLNDKLSKARLTNNHQNCSTKKVFRKILLNSQKKRDSGTHVFLQIYGHLCSRTSANDYFPRPLTIVYKQITCHGELGQIQSLFEYSHVLSRYQNKCKQNYSSF